MPGNQKSAAAIISLIIMIMMLSISGCANSLQGQIIKEPNEEQEQLKIGIVLPLTGNSAYFGDYNQKGAALAINKINNKIDFIWEDSKANAGEATTIANKLINIDKVDVIISSMSGPSTAIAEIAERNKILHIYITSVDAPAIGRKYVFKDFGSMTQSCSALAKALVEKGYKKIGFLGVITPSIQECLQGTKEVLEPVVEEWIEIGETDVSTPLAKIKKSDADFVIFALTKKEMKTVIDEMLKTGLKIPFGCPFYDILCAPEEYIKENPELYQGAYGTTTYDDALTQKTRDFAQEYHDEFGGYPTSEAAYIYDEILLIDSIFEKCGKNIDCMRGALLQTKNYEGAGGLLSFDKNGLGIRPAKLVRFENGEWIDVNK